MAKLYLLHIHVRIPVSLEFKQSKWFGASNAPAYSLVHSIWIDLSLQRQRHFVCTKINFEITGAPLLYSCCQLKWDNCNTYFVWKTNNNASDGRRTRMVSCFHSYTDQMSVGEPLQLFSSVYTGYILLLLLLRIWWYFFSPHLLCHSHNILSHFFSWLLCTYGTREVSVICW